MVDIFEMAAKGTGSRILILCGLRGVGKTELVRKFCIQVKGKTSEPVLIPGDNGTCATQLESFLKSSSTKTEIVIMDNLRSYTSEEQNIIKKISQIPNKFVIITAPQNLLQVFPQAAILELDKLDLPFASQLIFKILPDHKLSKTFVEAMCREVSCFPFMLHYTAENLRIAYTKYHSNGYYSAVRFLKELREIQSHIVSFEPPFANVIGCWKSTLDVIQTMETVGITSVNILNYLVYFSSTGIESEFMRYIFCKLHGSSENFETGINILLQFYFISLAENKFSTSKLVHKFIIHRQKENDQCILRKLADCVQKLLDSEILNVTELACVQSVWNCMEQTNLSRTVSDQLSKSILEGYHLKNHPIGVIFHLLQCDSRRLMQASHEKEIDMLDNFFETRKPNFIVIYGESWAGKLKLVKDFVNFKLHLSRVSHLIFQCSSFDAFKNALFKLGMQLKLELQFSNFSEEHVHVILEKILTILNKEACIVVLAGLNILDLWAENVIRSLRQRHHTFIIVTSRSQSIWGGEKIIHKTQIDELDRTAYVQCNLKEEEEKKFTVARSLRAYGMFSIKIAVAYMNQKQPLNLNHALYIEDVEKLASYLQNKIECSHLRYAVAFALLSLKEFNSDEELKKLLACLKIFDMTCTPLSVIEKFLRPLGWVNINILEKIQSLNKFMLVKIDRDFNLSMDPAIKLALREGEVINTKAMLGDLVQSAHKVINDKTYDFSVFLQVKSILSHVLKCPTTHLEYDEQVTQIERWISSKE
jgi:hypothetical protein